MTYDLVYDMVVWYDIVYSIYTFIHIGRGFVGETTFEL